MTSIPHAVQVCSEHYNLKDRSSCYRCPILKECQVQIGSSQEALDAWRQTLEAKAVQIIHAPLGAIPRPSS